MNIVFNIKITNTYIYCQCYHKNNYESWGYGNTATDYLPTKVHCHEV